MKNNFDKFIDRTTNKERKSDLSYLGQNHIVNDVSKVINSSIADLDFMTPEPIRKAIIDRANLSTYSYTFLQEEFNLAIQEWYLKMHKINIDLNSIKLAHGTVNALFQIVQALTNKGDNILIQTPIYGPFFRAVELSERVVVENPLVLNNNTYEIDFEDFENKIIKNNISLFLFCNPHNPGGVSWTDDQIKKIISICEKHDVTIVSDEVHGDLVLNGQKHNSIQNYKVANQNFIVCNSPNKAFNLGGLKGSYLIILNKMLREKIDKQYEINSTTSPNIFFQPALISAYKSKEVFQWLEELKSYIQSNFKILKTALSKINVLQIMEIQASYLVWIKINSDKYDLVWFNKKLQENNLIVGEGREFGDHSGKWFRINIGLPRPELNELIKRLEHIFKMLGD